MLKRVREFLLGLGLVLIGGCSSLAELPCGTTEIGIRIGSAVPIVGGEHTYLRRRECDGNRDP